MKTVVLGLLGLLAAVAAPLRVAVLLDPYPGQDTTAVTQAAGTLEKNPGFAVRRINMVELGAALSTRSFDAVVLDRSHHFTRAARDAVTRFITEGGRLVLLGAAGFVHPGAMTLPAFSRYEAYAMPEIASVTPAAGQKLVKEALIQGRFSGRSAIGFSRRAARFTPVLAARDRLGRETGWACGVLSHFAEYANSDFILFGIDTPAFYRTTVFARTLVSLLEATRDDALTKAALEEEEKRLAVRIKLASPAPSGFVSLGADGRHFTLPGGKRLFLIGANYHRSIDENEWSVPNLRFDEAAFEDDFRKAREAGINCLRLGPGNRFYDDPQLVKECARKYGVYVLVLLTWGAGQNFVENAERVARMYADEPMVIGYDLANEPPPHAFTAQTYDGEKSPALKLAPYERLSNLFDRPVLDAQIGAERGRPGGAAEAVEDQRNLAAFDQIWNRAKDPIARGAETTFPGLAGSFRVSDEYQPVADALNESVALWVRKHVEAIRKFDQRHLISIGYNNTIATLPANAALDFVSHHVYDAPQSYEMVMSNITTMDRLAALFPGKPVTLGEFGYSNGMAMPDGRYLDFHTSAVGEMAHYLYALAKGYDGCFKWVLNDWHWDVIGKAGDRGRATQIYEAWFGFYYYDGNPHGLGRMKPVAHATRFLSDYLAGGGAGGGTIGIRRGRTPIGAVYEYKAKDALFVGDTVYRSPHLSFQAAEPANVMLWWTTRGLTLMATADTTLRIDPRFFGPALSAAAAKVRGRTGASRVVGTNLELDLLEGETVTIR
jgi:hypothetical protein